MTDKKDDDVHICLGMRCRIDWSRWVVKNRAEYDALTPEQLAEQIRLADEVMSEVLAEEKLETTLKDKGNPDDQS